MLQKQIESNRVIWCWGVDSIENPGRHTPCDDEGRKVTIPLKRDQSEPAKKKQQDKVDLPQIPDGPKAVIVYIYTGSLTN